MSKTAAGCSLIIALGALSSSAMAADTIGAPLPAQEPVYDQATLSGSRTLTGRAAIIDGHTLWFAKMAMKVRLAGIDSCELPQWSFDPERHGQATTLKPVPCGSLAKAWLKRTVGGNEVTCHVSKRLAAVIVGFCTTKNGDLAKAMLRVGWARVQGPSPAPPGYIAAQQYAMAARYGMWATYVLDMDEWRAKAVDRTLGRKPIADFNLLAERESEVSPPFQDAKGKPVRQNR